MKISKSTYFDASLIATIVGIILVRLIGAITIHVYDDAFITFRYAENLITGNGFVYNPGEYILGVTAPLYALIVALIAIFAPDLPTAMVIFNIIIDCAFICLIKSLLTRIDRINVLPYFVLLFASSPIITRVTVGAMEMNLFALVSFGAIMLYVSGKKYWSVLASTVAYFLRPESALLVILLVFYEFFTGKKKVSLKMAFLSIALLIIPFWYLFSTYGNFIPQSVLSKNTLSSGFAGVINAFLLADFVVILSLPFAIVGLIKTIKSQLSLRILAIWAGLYLASYIVKSPFIWSWYAHGFRMVIVLFAAIGLDIIISRFILRGISFKLFTGVITAVIISVALWTSILLVKGKSEIRENVYHAIKSFSETRPLNDASILASDIGAFGYYSKAKIFDTQGLVTPRGLQYKGLEEMILSENPDYLFLNNIEPDMTIVKLFEGVYKPVCSFYKSSNDFAYRSDIPVSPVWTQEYVLYERIKDVTRGGVGSTE